MCSSDLNKKRIYQAENFYNKYGPVTIILARFIPVIRTFAPIVAGIGDMHYKKFISYNIFGGILWVICISLIGYYFGSMIPNIELFLLPIIALVIVLSILPIIFRLMHRLIKKTF